MTPREIEQFFYTKIPLTAAMGVRVESYDGETLVLTAPVDANHNHLGTAFGGSPGDHLELGRSFRRDAETGGRDAHPTRDLLPPLWPVILPASFPGFHPGLISFQPPGLCRMSGCLMNLVRGRTTERAPGRGERREMRPRKLRRQTGVTIMGEDQSTGTPGTFTERPLSFAASLRRKGPALFTHSVAVG